MVPVPFDPNRFVVELVLHPLFIPYVSLATIPLAFIIIFIASNLLSEKNDENTEKKKKLRIIRKL